jgi:diaminohydroxyphosphoribosylaminopyrimidine deaminase/5-amino-6-(5-phosphoribosylamino)uracil reductase
MPAATRRALETRGVEVWVLPKREKRVDLGTLMRKLGEREITTVLAEGGGTLLASLFEQGLVEKVLAFVAPIVIGGDSAPTPVRGAGIARLADAVRLDRVSVERIGADVLISGYVNKGAQ